MKRFEIALAIIGLVDSISYMVVAPSIVFYILNLGGTKEQYGLILSSFSFASFCVKPFLGWWSDTVSFRIPYVITVLVSILGGVLYSVAACFGEGKTALSMILAGRLLGGVGGANAALGFAYVARAVPPKERTAVTSALTAVRIIGMAAGPGVNAFLKGVDMNLFGVHFDELNSVGLVLVITNAIALIVVLTLLPEPEPYDKQEIADDNVDANGEEAGEEHDEESALASSPWKVAHAIVSDKQVAVPFFTIYIFNANFQVIETALAPAAADALGWGPVETSAVMGTSSIIIFGCVIVVNILSKVGAKDMHLLLAGLLVSSIGYAVICFTWVRNVKVWIFILPILVATGAFAFLGAPNRSLFTAAVDSSPHLSPYGGTMQALLSMSSSVAGFTAPGYVASFFLRQPEDIDITPDNQRELSSWSLLSPSLTLVAFFLVIWAGEPTYLKSPSSEEKDIEMEGVVDENTPASVVADERTSLLKSRTSNKKRSPSVISSAMITSFRAESVKCLGVVAPDELED
uniref:Major facilitator superfamily (MFS) profile domain-containing protein n=1 Tax=Helicotheca tamesis TaxID=374047 RepID=A0A7S2HMT8_9STRA|mmetsp:Transcript_19487/g.26754  ORF Transcript_19487/g.26754 Transcript_19487/m.26754 type:complete len:518 (+) Transcript_19487:94-1647(+)